jgi:hypothetical protein
VRKKKHLLGSKREHALLPRLQEAETSGKAEALAAKQRRKRAANAGALGAVSGLRATLDELLAAGEAKAEAAMAQSSVGLTAKKRLKLVAEETVGCRPACLAAGFCSHPHRLYSHPYRLCSHPHRLYSYPHRLCSHPHRLCSHPHRLCSPPHHLCSHPHRLCSHSHRLYSHPHRLYSHPHR